MIHPTTLRRRFLTTLSLAALLTTPAWANRVALVIGNSNYAVESKLANPINDANLIAKTLSAQGFSVEVKTNLPKRDMELAISRFVRQSAGADSAVLYYAGHGAQPMGGGRNYLLPVDARIEGDDTLESDGIAADRIVEQMERSANPAKIRLVVLDACRNNRLSGKTRGSVRGLARMTPSDDYTLIAFSTNDQDVALDGSGANSPYAQALAKHLNQADKLPLRRIFELTATDVRTATQQKQKPRTYGDLDSRLRLNGTMVASLSSDIDDSGSPNSTQVESQARAVSNVAFSKFAGDLDVAKSVVELTRSDLVRGSGLLLRDYDSKVADERTRPDVQALKPVGIRNWVGGSVTSLADGKWRVAFRIWDVVTGGDLAGEEYVVSKEDLRRASHRMAEFVQFKLTGTKANYSSRMAFVKYGAGQYTLYVADSDGFGPQSALGSPQPIALPIWELNGQALRYVSYELGGPRLYIQEITTGKRRQIPFAEADCATELRGIRTIGSDIENQIWARDGWINSGSAACLAAMQAVAPTLAPSLGQKL